MQEGAISQTGLSSVGSPVGKKPVNTPVVPRRGLLAEPVKSGGSTRSSNSNMSADSREGKAATPSTVNRTVDMDLDNLPRGKPVRQDFLQLIVFACCVALCTECACYKM